MLDCNVCVQSGQRCSEPVLHGWGVCGCAVEYTKVVHNPPCFAHNTTCIGKDLLDLLVPLHIMNFFFLLVLYNQVPLCAETSFPVGVTSMRVHLKQGSAILGMRPSHGCTDKSGCWLAAGSIVAQCCVPSVSVLEQCIARGPF